MIYRYEPITDAVTFVDGDSKVTMGYDEAKKTLDDIDVIRGKATVVEEGNIIIKKAMTSFGEEAVMITNTDGDDESIMLFEYDWECLMKALERFKPKMGEWKTKERMSIPGFEDTMDELDALCDIRGSK